MRKYGNNHSNVLVKMKNRLLFLINLLLVGTIFHLTAQENEMINFNRAFINQIGYYNIIKSIQHQEGTSGNLIDASQQIENQSAYIEQLGTGLKTILRQENAGNAANIRSFGQNITQIVTQTGTGNMINSWIENSTMNAKEARLYQQGMNNVINLSVKGALKGEGMEPIPIAITQEGNDFMVSALMDPYAKPIEVHQYNGMAGGMEVQIRTDRGISVFPTKK